MLPRPTIAKPLLEIAVDLAPSWFPRACYDHMARASIHIRADLDALSPLYWSLGEIPLDHDLYGKFDPQAFDKCARNSQGS